MKGMKTRPQTDRKGQIEKFLGTSLSHSEYVQIRQTWYGFWQSPGKYAKEPDVEQYTESKTGPGSYYSLNDIKNWLESIRS